MSSIDTQIAMWGVSLLVNAGMAVVLARNTAQTNKLTQAENARKQDLQRAEDLHAAGMKRADDIRREDLSKMEAKHSAALTAMAAENHALTTKLLDERDRAISHSLNNHSQQVTNAMAMLTEHIKSSDLRFQAAANVIPPKLETELLKTLNAAQEFVRESAASKADFEKFCDEAKEDRKEMMKAITELEQKSITVEVLTRVMQGIKNES